MLRYYILHLNLNFLRHYVVREPLKCFVKLLVSIIGRIVVKVSGLSTTDNEFEYAIHVYLIKFGLPLNLPSSLRPTRQRV